MPSATDEPPFGGAEPFIGRRGRLARRAAGQSHASLSRHRRACAGMREHLSEQRLEWAPGSDPTAAERDLLGR